MLSDTLVKGLEAYRIGAKIRALRREKGLGLAELGAHCELSPGMLSKVERGQVFPTLPTLLRIALVFGVGLDHFFGHGEARPMFEITRAGERVRLPDRPGAAPSYAFESLDFAAERRGFEGFLAVFPASSAWSEPHRHSGSELLVVTAGALELKIHERVHRLGPEDAVHFDSGFPHSYRPADEEAARALVVVTRAAPPPP